MRHRIVFPSMLVCALAACGDPASPARPAPKPASLASLSRGGAPTPTQEGPFVDETISAICGFPVELQFAGKVKVLEFPNGRAIIVFPGFTGTFTNLATGQTVTRSAAGALEFTPLTNGNTEMIETGHNLTVNDIEGYVALLSGRFTLVFGADGSVVQPLKGAGRHEDLCALLA
jgi:hypothetical protein